MGEGQFYCEQCGGELEIIADGLGRCTYNPEHLQKIPKDQTALFEEAQRIWFEERDFDRAAKLYEKIIIENQEESAAHWGMVLCHYGIEYVKDHDGSYVPTCHRVVMESILQDEEYKLALKYAETAEEEERYRKTGELIEKYQREIKQIASSEEPVDVFISFKMMGDNGRPTTDSQMAERLYNYLTKELRLKVFYSPVSLQGKIGKYEPYIYAALKSAQVMILVASRAEHIEASWVKNEWGRFIRMIPEESGKKKMLAVAALDGMTRERLPEELRNDYQLSNLEQLDRFEGFCHYVDSYIEKEIDPDKTKERERREQERRKRDENVFALMKQEAKRLLGEAEQELKKGNMEEAFRLYDQVLTKDSECDAGYWGKLLASKRKKDDRELRNTPIQHLEKEIEYRMAVQHCKEEKQKRHYEEIRQACADRYEFEIELARRQESYEKQYEEIENAYVRRNQDCTLLAETSKSKMQEWRHLKDEIPRLQEEWERRKNSKLIFNAKYLLNVICFWYCLDSINTYDFFDRIGRYGALILPIIFVGVTINIIRYLIKAKRRGGFSNVLLLIAFLIMFSIGRSVYLIEIVYRFHYTPVLGRIFTLGLGYIAALISCAAVIVNAKKKMNTLKEQQTADEEQLGVVDTELEQCKKEDIGRLNEQTEKQEKYGLYIKLKTVQTE